MEVPHLIAFAQFFFLSRLYGVEDLQAVTHFSDNFLSRLYGVEVILFAKSLEFFFLSRLYGVEASYFLIAYQ